MKWAKFLYKNQSLHPLPSVQSSKGEWMPLWEKKLKTYCFFSTSYTLENNLWSFLLMSIKEPFVFFKFTFFISFSIARYSRSSLSLTVEVWLLMNQLYMRKNIFVKTRCAKCFRYMFSCKNLNWLRNKNILFLRNTLCFELISEFTFLIDFYIAAYGRKCWALKVACAAYESCCWSLVADKL